ncbi:hypothetical protein [Vibrio sp. FJH11]
MLHQLLIILGCYLEWINHQHLTITKPNIALEAERGLIPKMRNAASLN